MADSAALEEARKRGLIPQTAATATTSAMDEARRRGLLPPNTPTEASDLPAKERFRQGVGDMGQGVVQGINYLTGGALERNTGNTYDQQIDEQQAGYAARRKAAGGQGPDMFRLGGNVAAGLPLVAGLEAPATIPGALAIGAFGGLASSAMNPVTNVQGDYAERKAGDMAIGTAAGAGTGGLVKGVSNVVSPAVAPAVKNLMSKGITPTPGQIVGGAANRLEEKLGSVPFLGDMIATGRRRATEDFNRAAINDVLAPIGKKGSGKIGREGIEEAERLIGDEYDRILPNLTFQVDQQVSSEVANLRQMASFLPDKEAEQFEKVLTQKIGTQLSQQGTMDGKTFKAVESELSRLAKDYKKDPSAHVKQLGDAVYELLGSMRDSLARNNPMYAGPLQNANSAWAKFVRIQRAATSATDAPGVFSGPQFSQAVKAMDQSPRKGAVARGDALMQNLSDDARQVLGNKVPDSGTPGRIMAAMLGGGGAGFVEPSTLIASGALMLPYTKLGQKAMAALLTKRPPGAALAAALLRRGATPAAIGAANLVPEQ